MTKAAEAAALAGAGQEVALSPTAADADIQAALAPAVAP
jgi:chemotaxis protein MotB